MIEIEKVKRFLFRALCYLKIIRIVKFYSPSEFKTVDDFRLYTKNLNREPSWFTRYYLILGIERKELEGS